MDNETEILLYGLLRFELFGQAIDGCELSHEQYEKLMGMASKQTVQGLVADALMNACFTLDRADAINLYCLYSKIKQQNSHINDGLVHLSKSFLEQGINFVIVKGQMMAALYPNPLARCPGDVDMYFVGESYDKAKKFAEKRIHKSLDKFRSGKHVGFTVDGVIFELHDILSQFTYKHQRYFNEMIDKAILKGVDYTEINSIRIPTLCSTYNIVYIFIHLFFHMTASGLGLRQLCDFAQVVHTHYKDADKNIMREILDNLEYYDAFVAIGAFVVDKLGLPEQEFSFEITPQHKKWINTINNSVMKGGNFGYANRTIKKIGILHSIDTACLSFRQATTFYRLAPKEILWRVPNFGIWFLKRFKIKWGKRNSVSRVDL